MGKFLGWLYAYLWISSIFAGWVMQLNCFLFIKRLWEADQQIIKKFINYMVHLDYKHTIIMFPEGTDLTEHTKNSSRNYAEKNNLQIYENVLHPRTTGFTYLSHELMLQNALDAIYDVTLIYPDVIPQTEKMLFSGNYPKVFKAHLIRYPVSVLPKTEEDLKQFLEQKWQEKEKIIQEFKTTGHFLHGNILRSTRIWELYVALIFWSLLPYLVLYLLIFHDIFRQLVLAHTLLLFFMNVFSDGFQNFEIALYNLKNGHRK